MNPVSRRKPPQPGVSHQSEWYAIPCYSADSAAKGLTDLDEVVCGVEIIDITVFEPLTHLPDTRNTTITAEPAVEKRAEHRPGVEIEPTAGEKELQWVGLEVPAFGPGVLPALEVDVSLEEGAWNDDRKPPVRPGLHDRDVGAVITETAGVLLEPAGNGFVLGVVGRRGIDPPSHEAEQHGSQDEQRRRNPVLGVIAVAGHGLMVTRGCDYACREIPAYSGPARILVAMSTSAQLPLCVYCGTERPADRSQCPQCGRPWIDVRVGSLAESKAKVLVGAAVTAETPNVSAVPISEQDDSDEDLTEASESHDEPPAVPFRRAIPVVLGVSAAAVVAMFVFGLLDGDGQGEAAPQATTVPGTTSPAATAESVPTTILPSLPTTTVPPPPTSTIPTTTLPEPAALGPAGEPVPVTKLTLHSGGVGPIEIGTPAPDAVGRLIASLGTPEEVAIAGEEHGLCAGEDGRLVRWVGLTAIVSGTLGSGTFVGYRYEEPTVPTSHLDLATPSGIRLGDAISTLNEVYATYSISYESSGDAATFSLSDGAELLLWGPVSSIEGNGRVEGIYSPPACGSA